MKLLWKVAISVVLIISVILLIIRFFKKSVYLSKFQKGTKSLVVTSPSNPNNNSNYTYSLWFYIDEWNYRYGEEKDLLVVMDKDNNPCPKISLDKVQNDVNINVTCYSSNGPINHECKIRNVAIQSWNNLIVSLYGRTLDVYLDGKLVRTCLLPGVAKINNNEKLSITPNGGFAGWTSSFVYHSEASNPVQAYNIYKDGFIGNSGIFSNVFNKYKIKVAFLKDNIEKGTLEI